MKIFFTVHKYKRVSRQHSLNPFAGISPLPNLNFNPIKLLCLEYVILPILGLTLGPLACSYPR